MSLFVEHMQQLFEVAQSAAQATETTILIGQEGHIRVVADSDWPLDSLLRDSGARSAYRITANIAGVVRVEGREGCRRCVMDASAPARTARMLLGG